MSRDIISDLNRLATYGIKMEPDYTLATPDLLTEKRAKDYLLKELGDMGIPAKQLPNCARIIKNIVSTGNKQYLDSKRMPKPVLVGKLHEAGYRLTISKLDSNKHPTAVGISTVMGIIWIHMEIPDLEIFSDILNWGIPYETETTQ